MVALPNRANGRITAGEKCRRDDPTLLSSIAPIEEMEPIAIGGNDLWTANRQFHLQYDGISTVAIAVRSIQSTERSELMIVVKPYQVKVAGKYRIIGRELMEHSTKSATGSKAQASPAADVHVLIAADDLFAQMLLLKVNEDRYFIEFGEFTESGQSRKAAVVSTFFQYMYRVRNAGRELIHDPRKHFMSTSSSGARKSAEMKPNEDAATVNTDEPPNKITAAERETDSENSAVGKHSDAGGKSDDNLCSFLELAASVPLPMADDSWHTAFGCDDDEATRQPPAVDMSDMYGGFAHLK